MRRRKFAYSTNINSNMFPSYFTTIGAGKKNNKNYEKNFEKISLRRRGYRRERASERYPIEEKKNWRPSHRACTSCGPGVCVRACVRAYVRTLVSSFVEAPAAVVCVAYAPPTATPA